MPLYEYECDACGRRFERIQKFSDPPETTCPTCGGSVRKLLSSPAIQFKGSGFYITDYVKSGSSEGGKKSAEPSSSTEKADTKSKPESSPEKSTEGSPKADSAKTSETTTTTPKT